LDIDNSSFVFNTKKSFICIKKMFLVLQNMTNLFNQIKLQLKLHSLLLWMLKRLCNTKYITQLNQNSLHPVVEDRLTLLSFIIKYQVWWQRLCFIISFWYDCNVFWWMDQHLNVHRFYIQPSFVNTGHFI